MLDMDMKVHGIVCPTIPLENAEQRSPDGLYIALQFCLRKVNTAGVEGQQSGQ